jgi:hypothetical protein
LASAFFAGNEIACKKSVEKKNILRGVVCVPSSPKVVFRWLPERQKLTDGCHLQNHKEIVRLLPEIIGKAGGRKMQLLRAICMESHGGVAGGGRISLPAQ